MCDVVQSSSKNWLALLFCRHKRCHLGISCMLSKCGPADSCMQGIVTSKATVQKITEFENSLCRIWDLPQQKTVGLNRWLHGLYRTFVSLCQNGIYLMPFTCRTCTRAYFAPYPGFLTFIFQSNLEVSSLNIATCPRTNVQSPSVHGCHCTLDNA